MPGGVPGVSLPGMPGMPGGVPGVSLVPGGRSLVPGVGGLQPAAGASGGGGVGGAPDAKRARQEIPLVTESIWMKIHPDPIDVKVLVPDDPAHHKHSLSAS